ncbi:MAG: phosphoribosylamine--glycine ligase [Burkholderiaceae bacterium]
MKLLVVGGGGREHALAWRLAQSPRVQKVFVAPGNAGTACEDGLVNLAIDPMADPEGLIAFVQQERIAFTVVGPEAPLAAGLVDRFQSQGLKIFGPTRAAAQLESSKDFAKQFMVRHGIPTAGFRTFNAPAAALAYAAEQAARAPGVPIVVKADGLAAGKGVVVAESLDQAQAAITAMLSGEHLGAAGARVVIEDFLEGEEASFIVLCDGKNAFALATSQDHKRLKDHDQGPNTGGMGAYSPAPVVTPEVSARVMREIIRPTLKAMAAEGHPYVGFLYAGLMIDRTGAPRVVEFNCRLGDPETQPIMMRLRGDFTVLIEHAINGRLDQVEPLADTLWDRRPALGVVLAAAGYPQAPRLGEAIAGLPANQPEAHLFHAGTRQEGDRLVTSGGRVFCATALGESIKEAQANAYRLAEQVRFAGCQYRRDIGHRGIALSS